MKTQTIKIFESVMLADDTIAPAERRRILKLVQNGDNDAVQNEHQPEPRIYPREQAAKLIGRTPRFIDLLAKRGLLKKITPPGNVRSIGVSGDSLRAFIHCT